MATELVILICLGGIAGCAALVFTVEVLIAFVFTRPEDQATISSQKVPTAVRRQQDEEESYPVLDRAA